MGGWLAASSGPTTLMGVIFGASFILDIAIFSLLALRIWSAHSSRRIGRARAHALGMNSRYTRPADIQTGGWDEGFQDLWLHGRPAKISDLCESPFSRCSLALPVPLEQA